MSVALQSPFSGNKRLFEDDQEQQHPDQQQQQGAASGAGGTAAAAKRARVLGSSPAGRCRPAGQQATPTHHFQAGLPPSTVAAVKALFPGMDEKTVENVLAECGQDVDAAIRRLTQLKLGAEHAAAGSNATAAATAAAAADQDAAAAANGTLQQQDQHHQQQQQQDTVTAAAAAAAAAAGGPPGLRTADQWVDALVQEMASAKDFTDARARAGKLLQAFEQFVSERSKDQAAAAAAAGGGAGAAGGRLEEAVRENAILKRAVQIQNAKLQEVGSSKDQEVASLKQLLGQYQERLRHLELSNYSLALHLQKATDGQYQPANRPPDVF